MSRLSSWMRGYHSGSVLPRIAGRRTQSGFNVVVDRTGRGELVSWGCAILIFIGGLFLVVNDLLGLHRQIGRDIALIGLAGGLFAGVQQIYVRRRFRHGTLHVTPWPIRLGAEATTELRAFVRGEQAAPAAKLECFEEAIRSKGTRYQVTKRATIHSSDLTSAAMRWSGTRIEASWMIKILADCPASFQLRDRQVQWRIVATIPTSAGETTVEFPLLVIPEIAG